MRRVLAQWERSGLTLREFGQQRGVMNLAAGALEDNAELLQNLAVRVLQRRAVEGQQCLPAELRRHDRDAVVWWLGELVGHFEEQEQRQLLHVFEAHPGQNCQM
jgi:hypothetical protein